MSSIRVGHFWIFFTLQSPFYNAVRASCKSHYSQLTCAFQGIFISRVSEEGPAGLAGLRVGDKVLAVS